MKKIMFGMFISFLFVFGFVFAVECGDSLPSGTTVLDHDLINCSEGLTIGASNIILDCDGHVIDGIGLNWGLRLAGNYGVIIKNCVIQEFYDCIWLREGDTSPTTDHQVTSNILRECSYGVHVTGNSYNHTIWDNQFYNNSLYNAHEDQTNYWDNNRVGNYWDDFELNSGYPTHYEIPGPGSGVDNYPLWTFPTDLTLSSEDIIFNNDTVREGDNVTITALFYQTLEDDPNQILVNFYDGNPLEDGILIGSDLVVIEETLSSFFAQIEWEATAPVGYHDIYVYLDPNNEILEANETNNVASRPVFVEVLPDLKINSDDISFTDLHPRNGEEMDILAMVHNVENSIPTGQFVVSFYLDNMNNLIAEENLSLGPESTETLIVPWTAIEGYHTIIVKVDSGHDVTEQDEENNIASQQISVQKPYMNPLRELDKIFRVAGWI